MKTKQAVEREREIAREVEALLHTWRVHPGQEAILKCEADVLTVPCGRRWGKSEAKAMWHLRGAMEDRLRGIRGNSWVVERTLKLVRPVAETFLRIAPPGWITGVVGGDEHPQALKVGCARITFQSADHPERLVSEGLRRCSVDECGIVNDRVVKESVLPTMIDHAGTPFGGKLLLCGVPKGKGSFFYEYAAKGWDPEKRWKPGRPGGFETITGNSFLNPFMPRWKILEIAREMPPLLRRQEIGGEFIDDAGGFFQGVRRLAILPDEPPDPRPECHYAMGVDWARAVDFTVATIIEVETMRVVGWYRDHRKPWPDMRGLVLDLAESYGVGFVCHDRSGVGDTQHDELEKALRGKARVSGIYTNRREEQHRILHNLRSAIEDGVLTYPRIPVLLDELDNFEAEVGEGGLVRLKAPDGKHDDCVISMALATWCAGQRTSARVHTIEPHRRANAWTNKATQRSGRGRWAKLGGRV